MIWGSIPHKSTYPRTLWERNSSQQQHAQQKVGYTSMNKAHLMGSPVCSSDFYIQPEGKIRH